MRPRIRLKGSAAGLIAGLVMLLATAASAAAQTSVRFVQAVPRVSDAELTVGGQTVGGPIGFGEATDFVSVQAARAELRVDARRVATANLRDGGRYTVVALREDRRPALRVYRDSPASAGEARVRAIQAAGELGEVDVRSGQRSIARRLDVGDASPYVSLDPGTYSLEATRAGGRGGALASRGGVSLTAGGSFTAVIVGSGGEPTRFVLLGDATAAPAGAPATGLGGLANDGGVTWPIVLLAALVAGALGGTCFWLLVAAGHRRGTRAG